MKLLSLIVFILFSYSSSQANEKICSWIMDEPFKEYQKESKDKHSSMYVVVNDGDCEYGIAIGEKSEEKAKKSSF